MHFFKTAIRESVIPDIQVRLLKLCLNEDENGIILPITKRDSHNMVFRADWVLQEVISDKIKQKQENIPLVIRKRRLYEDALKKEKEERLKQNFEKLLGTKTVPIKMRKYLLYQEIRAS